MSTDTYIKGFRYDCRIRGLADSTISRYIFNLNVFLRWMELNNNDILELNKIILRKYLEYLRYSKKYHAKSLKNMFSTLTSFYDFLIFEEVIKSNPVRPVQKRYLHQYKSVDRSAKRKIISVNEMGAFVNSIPIIRDKLVVLLFAKTGIRRNELIGIDLPDISFQTQSIILKSRPKRTNCRVLFDDEVEDLLKKWIVQRELMNLGTDALFINQRGERMKRTGVYNLFVKWATKFGLHNPSSLLLEDHFTPHCCRHWFTTHLRKAGMPREFIQELRGDSRREAIDIYDHIDLEELRNEYLVRIPLVLQSISNEI